MDAPRRLMMSLARSLLHRLGLASPPPPDRFDLRLGRLGRRERRIRSRALLFRSRPSPLAA